MGKKVKGLNNIVAKNSLANMIADNSKKLETQRFYNSDEGKLKLILEKTRIEIEQQQAQFEIGQLVWCPVVLDDFENCLSNGKIAQRCDKIVHVGDGFVDTEMLYIVLDNQKYDWYVEYFGGRFAKGHIATHRFYSLEKHNAKNGNVWWRVK
jgi:hypothetical protein